jgi:hypothetical protein
MHAICSHLELFYIQSGVRSPFIQPGRSYFTFNMEFKDQIHSNPNISFYIQPGVKRSTFDLEFIPKDLIL